MNRRVLIASAVLALVAVVSFAGNAADATSWTGWVSDSHCNAKGAKEGHADCCKKCVAEHGAKLVIVTADNKVFNLDPQDKVAAFGGQQVKVTGTLKGDTITVQSVEKAGK